MLDESLSLLASFWSGEAVHHHGKHYQVEDVTFLPKPVQQPRIPIWVAGCWLLAGFGPLPPCRSVGWRVPYTYRGNNRT
ncbi:MAG: LLM class flavin-dependent oxidoreductase [Candidatus Dormibacteraceae bacterium]